VRTPLKVLVVDDNPGDRHLLITALEESLPGGVNIECCGMLCEALVHASAHQFDVALVDLGLPDAPRSDVVSLIMSVAPDLPLIAISSDAHDEVSKRAVQQGAEDFIHKIHLTPAVLGRVVIRAAERGSSRAHYRGVIASLPDPLLVVSTDGDIVFANHAAAELFGWAASRLTGRPFPTPVLDTDGRAETWIRHAAGEFRRVELAVVDSSWAGGAARLVSVRDITARHFAVAAVHAEARKFQTLVDRIPGVVWTTGADGGIAFFGGGQLTTATEHHQDLVVDGVFDPTVLLGDSGTLDNLMSKVRMGASCFHRHRSGERDWEIVLEPLHDHEGKTDGVIAFATDATERHQLEQALVQAQKLEAVGQLAAGVAHELNTPIQYLNDNLQFLETAMTRIETVLDAYADVVANHVVDPAARQRINAVIKKSRLDWVRPQIAKALVQSLEGVAHSTRIVRAMKDSVHHGQGEMVETDLNKLLTGAVDVTRNEWKYVANVETQLQDDLPPTLASAGELSQVFINLIVNAAHAIAEVTSTGDELGRIYVRSRKDGDSIVIEIEDTGGGIPDHVRDRIFDPFFTTKEVGKGTGQGLAIARRVVVDTHGGQLDFVSRPGDGTRFVVALPIEAGFEMPEKIAS